ncbi:unnamed protein product, partial [Brachionus calyciflorus]
EQINNQEISTVEINKSLEPKTQINSSREIQVLKQKKNNYRLQIVNSNDKNEPENSNTQPKTGVVGSFRDSKNQNPSKINKIILKNQLYEVKPCFEKNELREVLQRIKELSKIKPIDLNLEKHERGYSYFHKQFNSKKLFILKIIRNKEKHEIKIHEYIKPVGNKKSNEIETKKKMLELRNESVENRFKYFEKALA